MTDNINSKELQEMKEQLALLNRKLEREAIVNDRLMRQAMKDKAKWLRHKAVVECIITLIMIPYFIWVVPDILGISIELCMLVCSISLLALVSNIYVHSRFRPDKFIHENLIEVKKDTLMLKKYYANWLKYVGIPYLAVFLYLFTKDIMNLYQGEELQHVLGGMAIGLVIGGVFGVLQYRKIQNTANDILRQIEEMERE